MKTDEINEIKEIIKSLKDKRGISYFLFSFKGRISKKTFLKYNLIMLGLSLLAFLFMFVSIEIISSTIGNRGNADIILILILLPIIFLFYWISLAITVKRFHDFNVSGWIPILISFSGIGLIVFVLGVFYEGDKGENKYGEDPLNY